VSAESTGALESGGSFRERPGTPALGVRLLQVFRERYAAEATFLVRAPGRVNLLGEHTDYNEGFVLPMAIDRSIGIALRPRDDRRVVLRSLDFDEERTFDLDALDQVRDGWIEYVKGTAWALGEASLRLRGFEGVLAGEVPMGAGLSSSAALEIAVARAFLAASHLEWDPVAMARLAQRAENAWVGVHCGIMDQLIVACARAGHALLIDCRDLDTTPCPLPPDTVVVVLDTATRRDLGDSAYNQRRAGCEHAARLLGLRSLRDLSPEDLRRSAIRLPVGLLALVRHVVTENVRTLEAAEALRRGDPVRLGELMAESHRSLRDDYRVSCHALDAMVLSASEAPGCFGARMTGAGFGGCVVALVRESDQRAFTLAATRGHLQRTGLAASAYVCRPSAGASVEALEG
jgi:galactokinase